MFPFHRILFFTDGATEQTSLFPAVVVLGIFLSLSIVGISVLVWKYYRHLQEERLNKKAQKSQLENSFSTPREIESPLYFDLSGRGTEDEQERSYQRLQHINTSSIYENVAVVCKTGVNRHAAYENVRNLNIQFAGFKHVRVLLLPLNKVYKLKTFLILSLF